MSETSKTWMKGVKNILMLLVEDFTHNRFGKRISERWYTVVQVEETQKEALASNKLSFFKVMP